MNRRERAATRIQAAGRGHLVREDMYLGEYLGDQHWDIRNPDKTGNRNYDRGWLRYALETRPAGPGFDNWVHVGDPRFRLLTRGMVTQATYARTNEQMRKHMLRYKYYENPGWRGSRAGIRNHCGRGIWALADALKLC